MPRPFVWRIWRIIRLYHFSKRHIARTTMPQPRFAFSPFEASGCKFHASLFLRGVCFVIFAILFVMITFSDAKIYIDFSQLIFISLDALFHVTGESYCLILLLRYTRYIDSILIQNKRPTFYTTFVFVLSTFASKRPITTQSTIFALAHSFRTQVRFQSSLALIYYYYCRHFYFHRFTFSMAFPRKDKPGQPIISSRAVLSAMPCILKLYGIWYSYSYNISRAAGDVISAPAPLTIAMFELKPLSSSHFTPSFIYWFLSFVSCNFILPLISVWLGCLCYFIIDLMFLYISCYFLWPLFHSLALFIYCLYSAYT